MKKLISIMLVAVMLLSVLVACAKTDTDASMDGTESSEISVVTSDSESNDTEDTETEESSDTDTEETESEESSDTEETTEPDDTVYTIVANGQTDYSIVIPDSNGQEFTDAVNNLRMSFKEDYNATISLYKESTFKTINNGSMDAPKIVVNSLKNDEESNNIKDTLDHNSFTIKMVDGTLYIIGGTEKATILGIDYLIYEIIPRLKKTLSFSNGTVYETDAAFPLGKITINGTPVHKYSIVYYDGYYAKIAATEIQSMLWDLTGVNLPVKSDAASVSAHEILIGKTNRSESKSVRAEYQRPNINYDITEKNGKLVIMAEGFSTLEVVKQKFDSYLNSLNDGHNIVGSAVSGDVLISDNASDPLEGNMLQYAKDTDIRVMAWNMGGPGTSGKVDLAEKLADAVLKNFPDILGTNEFYDPKTGAYRVSFDVFMKEVSEYYYEIESDYDFPSDSRLTSFVNARGPRPQKIFIRKNSGIKVIDAGWRYTEYQKDINFRSFPWAVLETKDGDKFIYTVSHYTNMTNDTAAAIEQLATVAYAQAQSGSSTALPVILSGDLWMARGKGSYKYFTDAGYKDAQIEAKINANGNINHGTFHDYGKLEISRSITDLIMYSSGLTPLQFKVITSKEAMDSSDHYPVCTDFKFK